MYQDVSTVAMKYSKSLPYTLTHDAQQWRHDGANGRPERSHVSIAMRVCLVLQLPYSWCCHGRWPISRMQFT